MRGFLYALLSLAAVTRVTAFPDGGAAAQPLDAALGLQSTAPERPKASPNDELSDYTVFNGQQVPPIKVFKGKDLEEGISKGYWLVEFFSPYCAHCRVFAPVLQTAYEFYYTSKPLEASTGKKSDVNDLNSFTRFYDFRFAKIDCSADGDTCANPVYNVMAYPTLILFKDGKEVKRHKGELSMNKLGEFIEESLETIRPGSRPKDGVKLPKQGAHESEAGAKPEVSEEKDKDPAAGSAAGVKQNAVAKTATKEIPNPQGTVVPLTAESFQRLVTITDEPWFIKFYAPWCHHCQAMAPNWIQMAKDMKGRLNVGEVNCDVEKRLCKDAGVKGYPTLVFFRGGERVEYNGLRGVGDLISYAEKAVDLGKGVQDVDEAAFEKLEETEEVIFVYFYDHATTSEDFAALDRLTLSLIGHGKLVKTNDKALYKRFKISTWPRLMVSREGKPSYYPYLAPKDMRNFRQVLNWMKTVWLPLVPELTASNAKEIMDGKLVVLGILSRERSDEFIAAKHEMKNAVMEWIDKQTHMMQLERQELRDAKQLRIEEAEDRGDQRALRAAKSIRINMADIEHRQVGFAWVDGVFWERWIRTTYGIDVKDGEKVIINDEDNRRYWDVTPNGDPIRPSRFAILETLKAVVADPPKIPPKSTTSRLGDVFFSTKHFIVYHPWVSLGMILGFVGAVTFWGKNMRRVKSFGHTGSFFQLDEKHGLLGNLGGGSSNGKVD